MTIPANSTAVLRIPTTNPRSVTETAGQQPITADQADGVTLQHSDQGRQLTYRLGSGTYTFTVTNYR